MDFSAFGETFVTLVVIMDPIGIAPVFLAVTSGMDRAERRRAIMRAVLAAAGLVLGFALVGKVVLDYLNVSVEALSIAGGLLLLLVALEMLLGRDFEPGSGEDVALVPLATPLVAGPGAIATVIVLTERYDDAGGQVAVLLGILLAVAVVGLGMLAAEKLADVLPGGFVSFLTRVFGLLLSAIAVQLVIDGVQGLS